MRFRQIYGGIQSVGNLSDEVGGGGLTVELDPTLSTPIQMPDQPFLFEFRNRAVGQSSKQRGWRTLVGVDCNHIATHRNHSPSTWAIFVFSRLITRFFAT